MVCRAAVKIYDKRQDKEITIFTSIQLILEILDTEVRQNKTVRGIKIKKKNRLKGRNLMYSIDK